MLSESAMNSEYHFKWGKILKKRNDFQGAAKAFQNALLLDPKFVDAKIELARTLLLLNRAAEASLIFAGINQLSPENNNPTASIGLASSLSQLGMHARAMHVLHEVLADEDMLSPETACFAHYELFCVHMLLSHFNQAMYHIGEVVRLLPDYASGFYQLGALYLTKGYYSRAEQCYGEAFKIDPSFYEARRWQAYCLFKMNRFAEMKPMVCELLTVENHHLIDAYSDKNPTTSPDVFFFIPKIV
jgi:protein O-GlcNAc transferase